MAQTAQRHQCVQSQTTPQLHFCPLEAEAVGLNEAIVISRVRFWLSRSKHIYSSKPWIYNTYSDWQLQFPFWSVRTIQGIFLRLEQQGILKSTNRLNKSRYDKTKWYSLDEEALAKRLPEQSATLPSEPVVMEATSAEAPKTLLASLDSAESAPSKSQRRSPERNTKSACACEPDETARPHSLRDEKPEEKPVNDLDAAYTAIPEVEREAWYERADRALEAAGMPSWMRIAPTVREAALRMWVGEGVMAAG